MLTPEDKDLLVKKGISEQQIAEQLACFEKGFPFLKLDAAASVETVSYTHLTLPTNSLV